ncbi:leucine--tRNA ligase [Planctomicrobium sp. SH527]|uniref:leucine--tRNA ligase n=1 Tax=Planctomicrobium sp. SH527 TaxID=3448123 RepID=UPI003F5B776B
MPRYDAKRIEQKWQAYWDEHQTFVTSSTPQPDAKGKLYALDMFPYPSGAGLHVGHPEGYTATDIVVRTGRMRGMHVLHPMGWDAFGLPAEQHAINTGTHPRVTTYQNIDNFRRQLKMLGFSYDWSRELSTTDEEYYKWTQWIFLQLYDTWYDEEFKWTDGNGVERVGKGRPISDLPIPRHVTQAGESAIRDYQDEFRLAYQSNAPVNWCPALGTVLANEEITSDGRSERGNHPVERRNLRQWMLRITAYAERLISELEELDWPESVKLLQRNWIGRSVGAEVDFLVEGVGLTDTEDSVQLLKQTKLTEAESEKIFDAWKAARVAFGVPRDPEPNVLRVYTTRPDTLYGVTYMVLAPEHPLVGKITSSENLEAVEEYRRKASLKSDLDRTDLAKEKSGVFTGAYAINPVNRKRIPIWIADYVLISYGTGAIMAVPAHDERDWEFAKQFHIPIIPVVGKADGEIPSVEDRVFSELGVAINSDEYNGLTTADFKKKIAENLKAKGLGEAAVNYRLRDWLFSRQRYWGEPFPIWHELDEQGQPTGKIRPVEASELPVTLPEMEDFKPKGTPDPPLSWAPDSWLYKTAEDGVRLKRETNSMPQWAGSCWYYIRFCDNKNSDTFIDPELEKYWLPVDLYIGGAEHAVLHLLYSRFWHKVLFDRGFVSQPEPFKKLVNQGMILGEAEITGLRTKSGTWVSTKGFDISLLDDGKLIDPKTGEELEVVKLTAEQVTKKGEGFALKDQPEIVVESRAFKMSKSRGNVINPDEVVSQYGADSLRLYEMFMGPLEQMKPWSMSGVEGVYRFLGRVWRMIVDDDSESLQLSSAVQDVAPTAEQERILHKTIKAVSDDIDKLSLNTAISRMMEFTNAFTGMDVRPKSCLSQFVLLVAPFAPHIAEELWEVLGNKESLTYAPWPVFDPTKVVETEIEIPVQINGKLKTKLKVPADADQAALQKYAEADEAVQSQLAGKTIVKVVCVPKKMVNFVVK